MRVLHLTTEFPPVIYGGLGTAVGGLVGASRRGGIAAGVLLVGPPQHGRRGAGYGRPSALPGRQRGAREAAQAAASEIPVFPLGCSTPKTAASRSFGRGGPT